MLHDGVAHRGSSMDAIVDLEQLAPLPLRLAASRAEEAHAGHF